MAVDHYENFPVASLLLPSRLRPAVEAIYAFARSADDLADEGEASAEQRIRAIDGYSAELDRIVAGSETADPIFAQLRNVIAKWQQIGRAHV